MFGFFSNRRNFSLPSIYTGLGVLNSDMIFKDIFDLAHFRAKKKESQCPLFKE